MYNTGDYLETQIATATPQKLRLMLIEGALGFARQTLQRWERGEDDYALDSYQRARDIVIELGVTVQRDGTELTNRVIALYVFLAQTLIDGYYERSVKKCQEVIRLLEIEQATWQAVCEQHPAAPVAAQDMNFGKHELSIEGQRAIPPVSLGAFVGGDGASFAYPSGASGFSVEG